MRLLPLCWLLGMAPALAAPVQLRLLEWGYLPAGYEQQFADYAKAHGVEATVCCACCWPSRPARGPRKSA